MNRVMVERKFQFCGLEFIEPQGILLCGGEPLKLRPRALILLRHLIENHHHNVSLSQLETVLWPRQMPPRNGLNVLICELRKILSDTPSNPVIRTAPGYGYQFVANLNKSTTGSVISTSSARSQAELHCSAARRQWDQRSQESLFAARAGFETSVVTDPTFALAQVGIADTLLIRPFYGHDYTPYDWEWSKQYAYQALAIDSQCGAAYASIGWASYLLGQFGVARAAFDRSMEVQPDYAVCHQWLSVLLMAEGKKEESISHARRAVGLKRGAAELDNLGHMLFYTGRFDEAEECFRDALGLDPAFAVASCFLGLTLSVRHNWDSAVELCRSAVELNGDSIFFKAALGYAAAGAGALDAAIKIKDEIVSSGVRHGGSLHEAVALVACGLGRHDEARSNLELAIADRAPWTLFSRTAPMYQSMKRLS